MRVFASAVVVFVFLMPSAAMAQSFNAGQDLVLKGTPTIAKAFAPLAGVDWKDFARVLASICSVESRCDPRFEHIKPSGTYSQYQGLFQMNIYEVAKAEGELSRMLPQIRQLAQSGTISSDVLRFIEESVREGEWLRGTDRDRRFHPSYGMILGAVKHIQINRQLATKYPGLPYHQAAGHMTAQFSGITEGKIRRGDFTAPITGDVNIRESEAWALGQNRVMGQGLRVQDAIESARTAYSPQMQRYVNRMAQVTGDLTLEMRDVVPFTVPAYRPGSGPLLGVPHSGVSTLMEAGLIRPQLAPSVPQSGIPAQPTPLQPSQTPAGVPENQPTPQTTPTTQIPFAAGILAQPRAAKAGEMILVSWATIGMQADSCTITERETVIGKGVNGTERTRVPLNATELVYRLSCTAPSAKLPIVREAEVKVTP